MRFMWTLIDESGAIATIATILASNRISIKNIGILHNREFQEGVLRIEFYEQRCSRKSHCPFVQVFIHHSYALNKMKYALRSSLVVSIFGKATCRNGLCRIIRVDKQIKRKPVETFSFRQVFLLESIKSCIL